MDFDILTKTSNKEKLMNKDKVYLDNAATTNISAEVLNTMIPVMMNNYGNSTSLHSFGREASDLIEGARETIAETISAQSNEIYFTSSGSEANTWAIVGIAYANISR